MKNRFEFTQSSIKAFAEKPDTGRLYRYCSVEKGLLLSVTPTGMKSFYYHGRINGRPDRVPLGRFPETSVKKAKSRTVLVRAAIEEGRDPRAVLVVARKRRNGVVTLSGFFDVWIEEYATGNREGWEQDKKNFYKYCDSIAHVGLATLTPEILQRWHRQIGEDHGQVTANRSIGLLHTVLSKAIAWQRPDGSRYLLFNPASADLVARYKETSRERYLDASEIGRFLKALNSEEVPGARHFFLLALATGQRKTTIMRMRYEEIDSQRGIWSIPRNKMKGKTNTHPVPLIEYAQEIIQVRQQYSRSPWVFPGRRRNGKPIGNVGRWWNTLTARAEVADLTIHDLRRTLSSWMRYTGAELELIAQLLNHQSRHHRVTEIYARMNVEPVREAIQKAWDAMEGCCDEM